MTSNTTSNVKKENSLRKRFIFNLIISSAFKHDFKFIAKETPKVTQVIATKGKGDDETEEISYTDAKVIGNGSFGVVYQARLINSNDLVAIKKVLQDRRYKNRELQIMRRLDHQNIVKLLYFFFISNSDRVS